ncbi:extracellular solute-binding protein [Sphingosinithalassobacter portus]|uniref:extracellular solute-binding protein n=1 Tax=Stakelama portus TaxID=2676234 RepID=UPI000D6E67BF|nr:extracellular solute-binding protein [Sphingosinithalassobacter portus]
MAPPPLSRATRRQFCGGLAALPLLSGCSGAARDPISLWAMGNEAAALPDMLRMLAFPHAETAIDVQALPWSAAHEKLLTSFAGGSLPNVGQIGNSWLAELDAIGALVPVPSDVARLAEDQFPAVVNTNRIADRLVAIPWYVDTRVQFYRSDLLARAGYARLPLAWPRWKQALHALKKHAGDNGFAILMPLDEYEHLLTLALSAGASLLREQDTRGNFAEPAFLEALGFYKSLFDERLAPRISGTNISNRWQEFGRGTYAVYISGPWTIGDMRARLPAAMQDKWATTPVPGPNGIGYAAPGGSSLAVLRGHPEQEDRSWKLISALLQPEAQVAFQRATGDLPARMSVWQAAGLADDPIVQPFETQLNHARSLPKVPEWERIVTEMQFVAERMVRGDFTVAAAAAEMDRRADALLEKRRWMIERDRLS